MPRLRSKGFKSEIIPRYKQRSAEIDEVLKRIFLYGAPTRLTSQALKPLIDEQVSAETHSNIAKSLDDEVRRFHTRPIEDKYLYLFLDAVVLKERTLMGVKKRFVLVAYSIDGRREVIDFRLVNQEARTSGQVFN